MPGVVVKYRKTKDEESFLKKFNASLIDLEKEYIASVKPSDQPLLFVCGAPRSGTTLITQALARTGLFNYVDNFVARFWRSPIVGLSLEKSMGLRTMQEEAEPSFASEYGRTPGITEPHEFSYFWEYWLKPDTPHHIIPVTHLGRIDSKGLRDEINAILNFYNKPVFFKSIWFLSNPLLAYRLFDNVYFIYINRDLISNVLSILNTRKMYHGDVNQWFSVRPLNYREFLHSPVEIQAVEQVRSINNEIIQQTGEFPEKVIHVTYEELCNDPVKVVMKITDHIGLKDIDVRTVRRRLPGKFDSKNRQYSTRAVARIKKAMQK
jgi:LPS sulfotransferase NodH